MTSNKKPNAFRPPRCRACGEELEGRLSAYEAYEDPQKSLCPHCRQIGAVKERWQPIAGGSLVRVFYVKEAPNKLRYDEDSPSPWAKRSFPEK